MAAIANSPSSTNGDPSSHFNLGGDYNVEHYSPLTGDVYLSRGTGDVSLSHITDDPFISLLFKLGIVHHSPIAGDVHHSPIAGDVYLSPVTGDVSASCVTVSISKIEKTEEIKEIASKLIFDRRTSPEYRQACFNSNIKWVSLVERLTSELDIIYDLLKCCFRFIVICLHFII